MGIALETWGRAYIQYYLVQFWIYIAAHTGQNKDCATFLRVRAGRVWRQWAKPLCSWHQEIQHWLQSKKFALDFGPHKFRVSVTWWCGEAQGRNTAGCAESVCRMVFPLWFLCLMKCKWKLTVSGGKNAGLQGFRMQLPASVCKYTGVRVAKFWLFHVCWVHPLIGWSDAAGTPCLAGQMGSVCSTR